MVFQSVTFVVIAVLAGAQVASAYQCSADPAVTNYGFQCGAHHEENCLHRAETTFATKTVEYRARFLTKLGNATDEYVEALKTAKEIFDRKKAIIHDEEARLRCLAEYEHLYLKDGCRCGVVRVSSDHSSTVAGQCLPDPTNKGIIRPAYYKWNSDSESYSLCGKIVRQKMFCDGCVFACRVNGYTEGPSCGNPPF